MNCKLALVAAAMCLMHVVTALPGAGGPFGFGGFGPMGGAGFGPMAGGGFKQMGMSYGLIGMTTKAAKNEVKAQVDLLKTIAKSYPAENACAAAVQDTIQTIDDQLLTAFDLCDPKADMMNVRVQAMAYKQQMANYKMGKKACKMAVDPAACLTELNESAAAEPSPADGITDVVTKSSNCVADVKEDMLKKIVEANAELQKC